MPEISTLPDLPAGATGYAPVSVTVDGVARFYRATLVSPSAFAALLARVAALEAEGGGSPDPGSFTATDLAVLLSAQPTTKPSGAGQLWINGGGVAITDGAPSGTTTLTASLLTAALASLPPADPGGTGQLWRNGPLVWVTPGQHAGTTSWTINDVALVVASLPAAAPVNALQPYLNGPFLALS